MLHISFYSSRLGVSTVAENPHNIRPHQTSHPPVCAKKGEEARFRQWCATVILRVLVGFARLRLNFEHAHPFHTNHRSLTIHRISHAFPNCWLHSIRHIRRLHLLPRSVVVALSNNVADPVTLPSSAVHVLRLDSWSLRSHVGFLPSRAACFPPLVQPSPRPKHLGMPSFFIPHLPFEGSTCGHITRWSFLPC